MGNKAQILIKDLQVGSEYWVVSGHYSFTVLEKFEDKVIIKHVHGTMEVYFHEDRHWVIEEYN